MNRLNRNTIFTTTKTDRRGRAMNDNKRYVIEQTGVEYDSARLFSLVATNFINRCEDEIREHDKNRDIYPNLNCGFKIHIPGRFDYDYRKGVIDAKMAVENKSFDSIHSIIRFFDSFGIYAFNPEFYLIRHIQSAALSINRAINYMNDQDDICEIINKIDRDAAEETFLSNYQSTITFKDDKVNVIMFYLVEQWIPPEKSAWEFNTTITDANWYIQGLGVYKGSMRSCGCDYKLWYRDVNYGKEEISGGIGLLHGDD